MVSVVRTRDAERKRRLYELHFEQPMVLQAPLVLTFCADTFRTREWLTQRGARLNFDNLIAWHVAAFDAMIFAQTTALALESRGPGPLLHGHHAAFDARDRRLPGTAAELPAGHQPGGGLARRSPGPARPPADGRLVPRRGLPAPHRRPASMRTFGEREVRGWARYRALGDEFAAEMDRLGISSLAQFYTSDMKYAPQRFQEDSEKLRALLAERGFLP